MGRKPRARRTSAAALAVDVVAERARATVSRMSREQIARVASLDPALLAIALTPETEALLDAASIDSLRAEIVRLCRERAGSHAA